MKKFKLVAMILFIGIIAVSCKKEAGPAGPAGPAGTNGTNGNANVTVYSYGSQVFNSANAYFIDFPLTGITNSGIDSCLVMSYYVPNGYSNWYMAGQVGPGNTYQSRCFVNNFDIVPAFRIILGNPDGTAYSGADVTWDSVRVFVIPANTFRRAEADKVNFNNYNQVHNYFPKK